MLNKRRVKTILTKYKRDPNKISEENDEDIKEGTFENVTISDFDNEEKLAIKLEDEPLKNEEKPVLNDINDDFTHTDMDLDNIGADAISSDDEVLMPIRQKQTEKPPEPNLFNLENIMNTDNVSSDDDYFPPSKKTVNSKNNENENENSKTVALKTKPKKKKTPVDNGVKKDPKFLMHKKKLNPDHWKKLNLSEEQAMIEFKTRETSDKYLKANYKCKECFKGFSRIDMLLRHAKRAHEEVSMILCCPIVYYFQLNSEWH